MLWQFHSISLLQGLIHPIPNGCFEVFYIHNTMAQVIQKLVKEMNIWTLVLWSNYSEPVQKHWMILLHALQNSDQR